MATQAGRRWAEYQRQMSGGGSRAGGNGEAIFNVSANDLGQRSIFSKTPELNDEQGPGLSMFKDNTAAGRRLNVKHAISTAEEREALAKYASILGLDTEAAKQLAAHAGQLKKEQTITEGEQTRSTIGATADANIRQHGAVTGRTREDLQQAERDRLSSEDTMYNREVMRLGQAALPPGLSPEEYIIKGQEIVNQQKLTSAAMGKSMARLSDPMANAALAEARGKGVVPIGATGSYNANNESLISPGGNRNETITTGEINDPINKIFKPATTTSTVESTPPMQRPIKVNLPPPSETPGLDANGKLIPPPSLITPPASAPTATPPAKVPPPGAPGSTSTGSTIKDILGAFGISGDAPQFGMPTPPAPVATTPAPVMQALPSTPQPAPGFLPGVGNAFAPTGRPRPALDGSSDVKNKLLQEIERILTGRPTQNDIIRRPGIGF